MPSFKKVTVTVIVDSPLSRSWKAFTAPDSIVHWNFASDDWRCPTAINDLRVEGSFNYRMESKDGKAGFDFYGKYTNVIPENRIDYVLEDNREVSVEFRAIGERTEAIETFDAEAENSIDLQRAGWQAILNNFKNYVESNRA